MTKPPTERLYAIHVTPVRTDSSGRPIIYDMLWPFRGLFIPGTGSYELITKNTILKYENNIRTKLTNDLSSVEYPPFPPSITEEFKGYPKNYGNYFILFYGTFADVINDLIPLYFEYLRKPGSGGWGYGSTPLMAYIFKFKGLLKGSIAKLKLLKIKDGDFGKMIYFTPRWNYGEDITGYTIFCHPTMYNDPAIIRNSISTYSISTSGIQTNELIIKLPIPMRKDYGYEGYVLHIISSTPRFVKFPYAPISNTPAPGGGSRKKNKRKKRKTKRCRKITSKKRKSGRKIGRKKGHKSGKTKIKK